MDTICLNHPSSERGGEMRLHLIFKSFYVLSENNASHASTIPMYIQLKSGMKHRTPTVQAQLF
jgi:hypothetical protein